jgi:hypothetical protein
MEGIRCLNLGRALFFGYTAYDEMWNLVPQPNGWKIEALANPDG